MAWTKYFNPRTYFSREKTEIEEMKVERREFERKRTPIRSFFKGVGKVLERIAFYAVLATGIGTVQYVRGKLPFTEVYNQEYQMTQWFNEKPGPVLGPGPDTFWYLKPLYSRRHEEDGSVARVPAYEQSRECGEFDFRTADGLAGKLNAEYIYLPEGKEGARDFYFKFKKDIGTLDTIVKEALVNEIAKTKDEGIATGKYTVNIEGKEKEVDYREKAREAANERLRKIKAGVYLTNFAVRNPLFDERSARIRSQVKDAEEAAKARIINAQAEATEAEIQATATGRDFTHYVNYVKQSTELQDTQLIAQYASELHRRDNAQQIAEKNRRFIYVDNASAPGSFPPVVNQVLGSLSRTVATK